MQLFFPGRDKQGRKIPEEVQGAATPLSRKRSSPKVRGSGTPVAANPEPVLPQHVYGGHFAWVGVPYKMEIDTGWSILQWMNGIAKRLFLLEDISLAPDGGFRRPGDEEPLFPKAGVDLRWRWDEAKSRIIVEFWNEGSLQAWRWDELRPSEQLRFPSEVPDLFGIGHVGQFTFSYSLLSAAAAPPRGASLVDTVVATPLPSMPGKLASEPRGSYPFDVFPSPEACRDFARIFLTAGQEPQLFIMCPGFEAPKAMQSELAFSGGLSMEVVIDSMREFQQHMEAVMAQSQDSQEEAPESLHPNVFKRLAAHASIGTGLDFADRQSIMKCFLQPIYVILCLGRPWQVRLVTYGFVAGSPEQVSGERPGQKWTPFVARLLSPELTQDEDVDMNYQVRLNQGQRISTAACMASEIELLRAVVDAGQCSMLY
eukprot:TRINITY_DN61905_c0_g1_i1.p1 TRINITY_DN61905_c0_g1~~TRINITY_DN61905_c0_g1_i1.p1  ORF type:complete len:427 (-),score=96.08 TRINITY_DN61905_c0_g1_i1:32-1312(-)